MKTALVDVDGFRRDGYVVARGVFSASEVSRFRQTISTLRDRARLLHDYDKSALCPGLVLLRGDLLSMDELRDEDYIIFDERIVDCVKQLLGTDEVVYHGDSSAQTGEGERGFHKDCADRGNPRGMDWQGEYGVLRFGIYLQDHASHSGGLKVRRHSHKYVSHHQGTAVNLDTKVGDVVFWYLTTSHSGNFVRLRGAPGLCLHPRLESRVPNALRVPEEIERISVFCTYGARGRHLDHYIEYQGKRPDVPEHWKRCGVGSHLDALAASRGVELRRPSPDFGKDGRRLVDA